MPPPRNGAVGMSSSWKPACGMTFDSMPRSVPMNTSWSSGIDSFTARATAFTDGVFNTRLRAASSVRSVSPCAIADRADFAAVSTRAAAVST